MDEDGANADTADQPPQFASDWSVADTAGLLPTHTHGRRIPRAWDRKPFSPFARRTGGGKVWRRVQMPVFNTITRRNQDSAEDQEADALSARRGGTIQSPRKVVKKMCLNNGLGQDWRITDWEKARGSHLRKPAVSLRRRRYRMHDTV